MKHALLIAAFVVLVSGVASAEIPQVLGYQGRITDNSGVPVADGTYAMRFRIYDDETAGTLLWDSNDDSVTVEGGAFSVMLGESPHPTLSLAFDEDYWLLVTFDGEDQAPRKRLGSVGYAYMASGIVPGTEMVDSRNNPILKGTNLGTGAGLRGDSDQGDGVRGQSSATDGKGVYGQATASTGINYGVYGETSSPSGWGVFGTASATTGSTYGGRFESSSSTYGRGVFAWAKGTTGQAVGVYGVSSSPSGYAVLGEADATTGTNYGVYGKTNSSSGCGVFGEAAATIGTNYGVYGKVSSTSGSGVFGRSTATTGTVYGGRFESNSSTYGRGVFGWAKATSGQTMGVYGLSSSPSGYGIWGEAEATTGTNYGVYGETNSTSGIGVYGIGNATAGTPYGVYGVTSSTSGYGVFGEAGATTGKNYGVYGETNSPDGYGGYFDGRGYFSGNVGIGTQTPDQKLSVVGRVRAAHDPNENPCVEMYHSGWTGSGIISWTGPDTPLEFCYGSSRKMRIWGPGDVDIARPDDRGIVTMYGSLIVDGASDPNLFRADGETGNVGIGVYNPSDKLAVFGTIASFGPNGYRNVLIDANPEHANYGRVRVADDEEDYRAGMMINNSGVGELWAGLKLFRVENPNQIGTEICYACIEGPEAAAYIRGTARLENGRASITFPDHFQAVATEQGMTVQLTPRSAESEGLAVTGQSVEGIEVRELRNGMGSYEFHYTVMAVRKGFEDFQVIQPAMARKPAEPPPAPGT